ncbi:multicopper oxidase [Pseudohyphozyma bogoriensis]|nr:multicopper oxidase [Pseudohyphozyma bogoriensis]
MPSANHNSHVNTNSTAGLLQVEAQDSSAFVLKGNAMLNETAQTRSYDFVLEVRAGSPDGYTKDMLVVNGIYPGPTIEANVGDRIIVNVTNKMPNATAIHWHGLYQRGTPYYDGTNAITQCGIPSGGSLVYNFTLDGWSGTTWWHAHYSTQYTDGITGAFIVHDPNENVPSYDGDLVIQMSDLYHRFSTDLLQEYLSTSGISGPGLSGIAVGSEPVPDAGTINGVGQWNADNNAMYSNFTLAANQTYRLRLSNTGSFAATRFSVDDHTLTVVEADGTPVEPYVVSGLTIDVAQRYSVLLTTNQTAGAYWMRSALQQTQFTYTEPEFDGTALGIVRYGVANDTVPTASKNATSTVITTSGGNVTDLSTALLAPADAAAAPASNLTLYYTMSMQTNSVGQYRATVNSSTWTPLSNGATMFEAIGDNSTVTTGLYASTQYITTVPDVAVVDIIMHNSNSFDHPWHLHGHKLWIMGSGSGAYAGQAFNNTNPMRRDTVLIPAFNWVALRFVADNPGYWAFHCHLSWHMSAGLLMQFATLPSQAALLTPPTLMIDQCKSAVAEFQYGFGTGELNSLQDSIVCAPDTPPTKAFNNLASCVSLTSAGFGVITSAFTLGGLFSSFQAGAMADRVGRKATAMWSGALVVLGSVLMSQGSSIFTLAAGRFIIGLACGISTVLVPLFLSEVAPPAIKGSVGILTQLMICIGIFSAQVIAGKFPLSKAGTGQWRIVPLVSAGIAIVQIFTAPVMIESPKYLSAHSSTSSARHFPVAREDDENAPLAPGGDDRDRDDEDEAQESNSREGGEKSLTLGEVLRSKDAAVWKGLRTVVLCQAFQQGSYSTGILSTVSPTNAKYVTLFVTLVNVLMTIPAVYLIDRLGRRPLLVTSLAFMTISSFVLAYSINNFKFFLAAVFIVLFVASFSIGLGPIPFLLLGEVPPTQARPASASAALVSHIALLPFIFLHN